MGLEQPGLQPEMFGGTEKIGIGEDLPGLRKLMAQLRAISRQIVESGQDQQTDQARIRDSAAADGGAESEGGGTLPTSAGMASS